MISALWGCKIKGEKEKRDCLLRSQEEKGEELHL
jgi:hypothetical protein